MSVWKYVFGETAPDSTDSDTEESATASTSEQRSREIQPSDAAASISDGDSESCDVLVDIMSGKMECLNILNKDTGNVNDGDSCSSAGVAPITVAVSSRASSSTESEWTLWVNLLT